VIIKHVSILPGTVTHSLAHRILRVSTPSITSSHDGSRVCANRTVWPHCGAAFVTALSLSSFCAPAPDLCPISAGIEQRWRARRPRDGARPSLCRRGRGATYWILPRSKSTSAPFSASSADAIVGLVVIVKLLVSVEGVATQP
jgi:hypothetical protein